MQIEPRVSFYNQGILLKYKKKYIYDLISVVHNLQMLDIDGTN